MRLMLQSPTNPRAAWLILYLSVNILSAYIIFDGYSLLGESQELRLEDRNSVFSALLMVLATYVGILAIAFPAISRLKVSKRGKLSARPDTKAGITLLVLQALFMAFFTATGTFVAGSSERSESPFSAMWVIISVDSLFLIYYGFYRDSKLFWPNLIIAIASNLMRGWTGIFSIIAFMESARLMRSAKMNLRVIAISLLLLAVCFPIIQLIKLQTRFMASGLAEGVSFLELAGETARDMTASDYTEILTTSGQQIISRLHLVSSTIAVQQNIDLLSNGVNSGNIAPFWKEGIYGIAYDRITGQTPLPNLGFALATIIDPGHEEVTWNSNPGFFGWIIIEPESTPIYLFYTLGLLAACVYMIKKLNGDTKALDMLWFASLSYLAPGWIASMVLFTNSLLIFLLFHKLVGSDNSGAQIGIPPPSA